MSTLLKRVPAGLKDQVKKAVFQQDRPRIQHLLERDHKILRHLVALTYHHDERVRQTSAWSVGLAAELYPTLVEKVIERLLWAMDTNSGANSMAVPPVLQAIARKKPELLLPMVPDLVRLSADEHLHDAIADTLCIVVHSLPGRVGHVMSKRLNERIERGECCEPKKR
jgi:hypothetical protein